MDKLRNFWYYYKTHLLIGLAVLLVIGYLSAQRLAAPEADYHIGLVRAVPLTDESLNGLKASLTAAGEDLNGDGDVLVQIHTFYVDLADPSENAGVTNAQTVATLDADLIGAVSGIFLLEDVDTFQRITSGLLSDSVSPMEHGLYLTLRRDAPDAYIRLAEALF